MILRNMGMCISATICQAIATESTSARALDGKAGIPVTECLRASWTFGNKRFLHISTELANLLTVANGLLCQLHIEAKNRVLRLVKNQHVQEQLLQAHTSHGHLTKASQLLLESGRSL